MKKRHIEKELKEIETVVSTTITCNRCGKIEHESVWGPTSEEFKIHFGYNSPHDMERWEFDLCHKCIDEIVGDFKIKPDKFNEGPFGEQNVKVD